MRQWVPCFGSIGQHNISRHRPTAIRSALASVCRAERHTFFEAASTFHHLTVRPNVRKAVFDLPQ